MWAGARLLALFDQIGERFIGLPISVDGTRPVIRTPAPALGEGNADLLGDADPWATFARS